MNNRVGQPKKSAKWTQLKFRFSSLTALDRVRAKRLRRISVLIVAHSLTMPSCPAAVQLQLAALLLLRRRRRILTNYFPLIHQPINRTGVTRFNFPEDLAWVRLRFNKIHLHGLM